MTHPTAPHPSPHPSPDHPAPHPSRDDPGTTPCPVCQRYFTPAGRQRYCSSPCRKTAFRRRHQQPTPTPVPPARPRREHTVYECPGCGQRLLGDQRCDDCRIFTRRVGIGGACPHCDEPVTLAELLDQEVVHLPRTN